MDVFLGKRKKPETISNERRKKRSNKVDRISELPHEILVIILSRLPIEEAAKTSVLSKQWRSLWTFTTVLDFGTAAEGSDFETRLGRPQFLHWLNRILESHKAPSLDKLRICLDALNLESEDDIRRWVEFARTKFVQEFNLKIVCSVPDRYPLFPSLGFSNFNSLKALSLQYVNVTAADVGYFLSNCPSLERLCLSWSSSLVNLSISGGGGGSSSPPLKLKFLYISWLSYLENLEISAPNLVSFQFGEPRSEIVLKNVPLLAELSFLEAYHSIYLIEQGLNKFSGVLSQLQKLTLTLHFLWLADRFPKHDGLRNLKKLKLNLRLWECGNPCPLCTSLMQALPSLYEFSLHLFCSESSTTEWAASAWPRCVESHRHHCLKVVEVVGFAGYLPDTLIVRYLIQNAVLLEKMTIIACRPEWMDDLVELMTEEEKQEARELAHALGKKLSPLTKLLVL